MQGKESQAAADICSRNLRTVLKPEAADLAAYEAAMEVDFIGKMLAPPTQRCERWPLTVNMNISLGSWVVWQVVYYHVNAMSTYMMSGGPTSPT